MRGRQEDNFSSFEMGLGSITSLLAEISNTSKVGVKLLENINTKLDNFSNFMGESISSFMGNKLHTNLQSIHNEAVITRLNMISLSLSDIQSNIQYWIDKMMKRDNLREDGQANREDLIKSVLSFGVRMITNGSKTNVVHTNLGDQVEKEMYIQQNMLTMETNTWLGTISAQLDKIYKYLPKIGSGSEIAQNAESTTFDFLNLAKGIKVLKKELTAAFIKNFNRFLEALNNFMGLDTKKLSFISSVLLSFTTVMGVVGNQAATIATNFNKLSRSILLTTILLISPPFILAGAVLIGLLWGLRKAIGKNFIVHWAFGKLAKGIMLLTIAMLGMSYIPFESVMKTIVLIAALSAVISRFMDGKSKSSMSIGKGGIKKSSAGGIKGMTSFAIGIGILVLAMAGLAEVPYSSIFKMITFIALLGVTFKLFIGGGAPSLTSFAIGIGILVLSLHAMDEVDWSMVFKMVAFIALLGIALQTFKKSIPGLFMFSLGLGLLTLTMSALNELPDGVMPATVAFIAGLGIATRFMSKAGAFNLLYIGVGLTAIAAAFRLIAISPITIEKGLIFGGTLLFIGGIVALLGIPAVAAVVELGSGVMIALGIATLVVAGSLMLLSMFKINLGNVPRIMGAVSLLAMTFTLLLPLTIPGAISAVAMLPIVLMTLAMAGTLAFVSKLDINLENIFKFTGAILLLATTFALITPLAILAFIGAILMVPVMLSALCSAAVLMIITKLEITQDKLDSFNYGVKSVVKTINEFGIVELGKAAVKSALLIPISALALLAALTLRAISELDIPESKIDNFGILMNKFVTSMVEAVKGNVENLKKIEPGLKALSQLINVGSDLVGIVTAFANMNYNIYEVKDGKLQLTGVRKITDDEIQKVGVNVGKLIQGLLVPLAILSSDDDTWDFGNGVKVKNPFKGGWFGSDKNSGINRLSKIGNAFLPLTEAIKNIGGTSLLQNKEELDNFNVGIVAVVDTLTNIFTTLDGWETKNADKAVKNLIEFVEGFDKINGEGFTSINDTMTKFLDNLSDESKWVKIQSNLNQMKESFKDISKNINMINLEKALVLERNLKLLSESQTNENLKEVVEKLSEMIGMLSESMNAGSNQQSSQSSSGGAVNSNNNQISELLEKLSFEDVKALLSEIGEKLNITNHKLGGKLKVVTVAANSNSL